MSCVVGVCLRFPRLSIHFINAQRPVFRLSSHRGSLSLHLLSLTRSLPSAGSHPPRVPPTRYPLPCDARLLPPGIAERAYASPGQSLTEGCEGPDASKRNCLVCQQKSTCLRRYRRCRLYCTGASERGVHKARRMAGDRKNASYWRRIDGRTPGSRPRRSTCHLQPNLLPATGTRTRNRVVRVEGVQPRKDPLF